MAVLYLAPFFSFVERLSHRYFFFLRGTYVTILLSMIAFDIPYQLEDMFLFLCWCIVVIISSMKVDNMIKYCFSKLLFIRF